MPGVAITQDSILPGSIKQRHLSAAPTKKGDIYYGKDGNSLTPLALGTAGYVITATATGPAYQAIPTQTLNRAFGFSSPGAQTVANDVSWDPISPEAMTAKKLWAYTKTGPSGSSLTLRVWNITGATAVASVTVTAGATSGNTTSMSGPSISAGDVLRMDVTAIGATAAGSDVSLTLECSQP